MCRLYIEKFWIVGSNFQGTDINITDMVITAEEHACRAHSDDYAWWISMLWVRAAAACGYRGFGSFYQARASLRRVSSHHHGHNCWTFGPKRAETFIEFWQSVGTSRVRLLFPLSSNIEDLWFINRYIGCFDQSEWSDHWLSYAGIRRFQTFSQKRL